MQLLSRLFKPTPLPDSFRFGVAISDHQSEAFDDGFPPDIWDVWERQRADVVPRGRATDFWNRWEEDVLNAHRLGCRAFRFSSAWARVEPRPGEFDQSVLDHYKAIVLRLRDLDMEPIVTLCHFVWPQHVEDRGGLRSGQFAEWFAAYVTRVRSALDPYVRYWITFNEPNILLQGFYKLWFQADFVFPPGDEYDTPVPDQIETTIAVIRHLFEAHTAARQALRRDHGDHNLVSANVFQLGLPPIIQRLIDWNVKRLKEDEDWRKHFWRVVERPALLSRRFDVMIAPATHNGHDQAEQLRACGFDTTTFITGLGALVKQESSIHTLNALDGQPIAVMRGTDHEQAATVEARLDRSQIDFFDQHEQALAALDADRVAALVADRIVLEALAHLHPEYRVIAERFGDEPYVVAVEIGRPTLRQAVDYAIRTLQLEAGQHEIYRRYFPLRAQPSAPLPFESLPRTSRRSGLGRIQERGKLFVGVQRVDLSSSGRAQPMANRTGTKFDLGRVLAGVIFGVPAQVEFRTAALPQPDTLGALIRNLIDQWLQAWTVFSTFVSSTWWYLGMSGELPESLCPRQCVGQLDFVSLDYYFGVSTPTPENLYRLALSMQRKFNRAALWPGGLYQALRYYHTLFPKLPIVIAENGFADEPTGSRRDQQLAAHVRAVQKAVAGGVDVRAYCVWSITSNREWGLPQTAASDFGLYFVDMDNDAELKRRETSSIDVYRQLIKQRGWL